MQTLLRDVLAAWREAERIAANAPPESDERPAALSAVRQLRDLYAELAAAAPDRVDVASYRLFLNELRREISGRP